MAIIFIGGKNPNVHADEIIHALSTCFPLKHVKGILVSDSNRRLAEAAQEAASALQLDFEVHQIIWRTRIGGKDIENKGALFDYYKRVPTLCAAVLCYPADEGDKASEVLIKACEELKPKKRTNISRRCDPVRQIDIMELGFDEPMTEDESRAAGFPAPERICEQCGHSKPVDDLHENICSTCHEDNDREAQQNS